MDDDKRIENNEEEAVSNDNIAGEEGETNSEERDKSRPYVFQRLPINFQKRLFLASKQPILHSKRACFCF